MDTCAVVFEGPGALALRELPLQRIDPTEVGTFEYGGFWIRFGAYFIDSLRSSVSVK